MADECIKPDKHGWILEGFIPCTCKVDRRKADAENLVRGIQKQPYEQCPECESWDSKVVIYLGCREESTEYYQCQDCGEAWNEGSWPDTRGSIP